MRTGQKPRRCGATKMIRILSLEEKVAFLSRAQSYPHGAASVEVKETHMSWVFLVGAFVYKLKKPVAYPFLNFTTLAARRANCLEEVRLNSRLAKGVYLGAVPLCTTHQGDLTLEETGETVDWLVKMKRLPAELMLDELIAKAAVSRTCVEHAADLLIRFYLALPAVDISPDWVLAKFTAEHEEDARLLSDRRFALETLRTEAVLQAMASALGTVRPFLEARAAAGVYVEGHGDLRPEHVCLLPEPVFIDCLEFNRDLRILDPFDEISYLGLECERLGAAWIGKTFLAAADGRLSPGAPAPLIEFYRAARALLRARLALAHLTEPNPRTPGKWEPRAREYIHIAEKSLKAMSVVPT